MDKIAMVKVAEVSGVVAAMAEAELIKIASEEMFDAVVDAVSGSLDNDYDLNDVLAKTAEVMSLIEDGDGLEKEAGEVDERAAMAAYGELSLLKEAGDITEEEFAKEAMKISDILAGAKKGAGKVKDFVAKGAKGEGVSESLRKLKTNESLARSARKAKSPLSEGSKADLKAARKDAAKAIGRSAAVYGGGLAAAGGTAVGGKALYDKYKG